MEFLLHLGIVFLNVLLLLGIPAAIATAAALLVVSRSDRSEATSEGDAVAAFEPSPVPRRALGPLRMP